MTSTKKTKKPLIEKQRRERMNKSLIQIKQLVLQATNKNEMNYMKMEKADILEMTVTFLKNLQKSQNCLNHPISSAAVTQNFHTFQEATSTTLLSEDSPGRDARKVPSIQDKKQKLDSSGINSHSPPHSPLSHCNEHIFSSMGSNGVHGKIPLNNFPKPGLGIMWRRNKTFP